MVTPEEVVEVLTEVARRAAVRAVKENGCTHPEDIHYAMDGALYGAAEALTVIRERGRG